MELHHRPPSYEPGDLLLIYPAVILGATSRNPRLALKQPEGLSLGQGTQPCCTGHSCTRPFYVNYPNDARDIFDLWTNHDTALICLSNLLMVTTHSRWSWYHG